MQAILIICLIVAVVFGGYYYYVTTLLHKPVKFKVTDLMISPIETWPGEAITIFVKVTNVGEVEGNYTVNLVIEGAVEENKTVVLAGGASTTIEFKIIKEIEGVYTFEINGLTGELIFYDPFRYGM